MLFTSQSRSQFHISIAQSTDTDTHAAHNPWVNLFHFCLPHPSPNGQARIKSESRDAPKETPLANTAPFRRARTDHNQRGTAGARMSAGAIHHLPHGGGGCLFKLFGGDLGMPLLGISTRAIGIRRGGCVKSTPFRGSAVGSAPSEFGMRSHTCMPASRTCRKK